jgi:UvrB/uvrC motif
MEMPGDRRLAAAVDLTDETMHWVACRVEDQGADQTGLAGRRQRLLDEPADVPVYGTSLALVLQAILDRVDLTHLQTGRLSDLDATDRPPPLANTRVPDRAPSRPAAQPGPNAGLDEVRAAKETAIDQQDFELAARLRDREKALLGEQANRQRNNPSQT